MFRKVAVSSLTNDGGEQQLQTQAAYWRRIEERGRDSRLNDGKK